jgi:hypothetical protein
MFGGSMPLIRDATSGRRAIGTGTGSPAVLCFAVVGFAVFAWAVLVFAVAALAV